MSRTLISPHPETVFVNLYIRSVPATDPSTDLYDSALECCTGKLSWMDNAQCEANSSGVPTYTNKFYVSYSDEKWSVILDFSCQVLNARLFITFLRLFQRARLCRYRSRTLWRKPFF